MDLINAFIVWFSNHPGILITLGISSVFIFILSIAGISWFVAQIPDDYFLSTKRQRTKWGQEKPILRLILILVRNIVGIFLIFAGLLMIVLPGQGFLTIVTGLLLINYPGKFKLEQKMGDKQTSLKALNWRRKKANKKQ